MNTRAFRPEDLLGPLNDVERKNAPPELYVAGDINLLREGVRVSVVGSRAASQSGLAHTKDIARALIRRGIIVVSGLARGVDTAAHETTIAEGGRTICVLGTPLDTTYPPENRGLQEFIMREHLAVSQFPPGYPMMKKNWPERNRTMALVCDATVIVEAGESSGTLHQGWEALRLGRLLLLTDSVARDPDLSWPKEMIRYGAQIFTDEDLDLFLDELPERRPGEPVAL